jgi:hypothetical protein
VPDSLINLAEDISQRTGTTDGLIWDDGLNNGGVPIIDYRINMRVQGGTYSEIASSVTTKSYTATGLVLGTTYEFTVEARNSVGYSPPSASVTILHALVPTTPTTPPTTNSETNVIIDWTEPANNGAAITSYTILIQQSNGVFSEDITNCDGSDNTIVTSSQCTVPLSTLTSAPYSLSLGNDVNVKVIATNVKGDSPESLQGSGATIIEAPDAPVNLAEDTSLRSPTELGLTWNEGAANGGAAVTEYRISYAEQGGSFSFLISTANTNYLVTSLTSGTTYEFKVEAKNEYGYSQFSSTISLLAAYIPEIPTSVTTEFVGSLVKVSWTLPSDNGSPITAYKLYIQEAGTTTFT